MRSIVFALLFPCTLVGVLTGCASIPQVHQTQPVSSSNPVPLNISPQDKEALIVIGDISENPTRKIQKFQPMADYLATHLQEHGIKNGKVRVAPDMETMMTWLETGEVDLYFDSPFPAMLMQESVQAKPLLRRWKKGVAEYHTVFFVRQDSDIASLEDLKGKLLAIDEPASTSGFMLPIGYLLESGFAVAEKTSSAAPSNSDTVGYVFSGDDDNTVEWVLSQEVTAGAVDNHTFDKIDDSVKDSLVVLAKTITVPRNLTMVAPGLDEELVASLQRVLREMDEDPAAQEILQTFEKTAQFDELPDEKSLVKLAELYELVQDLP